MTQLYSFYNLRLKKNGLRRLPLPHILKYIIVIFSTEWDFLSRSITYYMPTEALSAMWAFYTVKMVEQLHHSSVKIMTDLAHPLKVLWLSLKSKPHSFVGCQTHSVTHFLSSFNFKFLYNQSIPAGWESHIEPLYTTEKKPLSSKHFIFLLSENIWLPTDLEHDALCQLLGKIL